MQAVVLPRRKGNQSAAYRFSNRINFPIRSDPDGLTPSPPTQSPLHYQNPNSFNNPIVDQPNQQPHHRLGFLTSQGQTHPAAPTPLRVFVDPPPMDDQLAKFLLSVVTRFFCTGAAIINTDTVNHRWVSQLNGYSSKRELSHSNCV